jgi:outer membrane protein assembly factor BamB
MGTTAAWAQSKKPAPANAAAPGIPWTQWGGPNRNFQTTAQGLRDTWSAAGPKVLWKRPLGEGYSSASVDGDTLYTMYGRLREEIVTALDARTGKTLWEHATPVNFSSDAAGDMGNGPYATPLVLPDRVITAGIAGKLQCLHRTSGKPIWTQELWTTHKGTQLMYGYASSPLAFRDTIIVPVGGKGKAVMAFKASDGAVAWSRSDFGNAYSSPIIVAVDGLELLITLLDGSVVAMNPHNGDFQWGVPFKADYSIAVATPVFGPGNLLFVSAEYGAGAKMIRIDRSGNGTKPAEVWTSNRLRLHHGNAMRVGDALYFTSGGKGSQAILSAVDAATGKIHWQERSIEKATFVWASGKLITLDQDGNLMLADPSPQGFKVVAKAPLLTNLSWTPPALVGTKLYIRDRRSIMAVDLG